MQETDNNSGLSREIKTIEERKLKERGKKLHAIWMGFGMFGLVGWSVTVPTLLGTMLGLWLDKKYPEHFSWTLTLLITGLITGCILAAYWVRGESLKMDDQNTKNER